jgi:hypothetical protein
MEGRNNWKGSGSGKVRADHKKVYQDDYICCNLYRQMAHMPSAFQSDWNLPLGSEQIVVLPRDLVHICCSFLTNQENVFTNRNNSLVLLKSK